MKIVVFLLVVIMGFGCAAKEPKTDQPLSRITVYREASPRDSVFPMLFLVNGRPVLQLQPKEGGSFALPAGEYRFEYELGVYNCAADVRIDEDKDYVYRLAQGCVIERDDQFDEP